MRIMALDIGEKRIGVAVTDKSNRISIPLLTIENDFAAGEKILNLIKEYGAGKIIIGMPYTLKGEKGFQSGKVMDFVSNNLKDIKIPITMMDERFTTKISSRILNLETMRDTGRNHKKNKNTGEKKDRDSIAASLILDSYIQRAENAKK